MHHSPELDARIHRAENLEDLNEILQDYSIDILIANPVHFVNREKDFNTIRKENQTLAVVAIDYGMMQQSPIPHDALLSLYDSPDHIIQSLIKLVNKNRLFCETHQNDNLTKREIEVLTGVVNGLLNKEIAESLNISVHTVVRHRKNITTKTGIRSQSGLTIYAISKKIINIEDIEI